VALTWTEPKGLQGRKKQYLMYQSQNSKPGGVANHIRISWTPTVHNTDIKCNTKVFVVSGTAIETVPAWRGPPAEKLGKKKSERIKKKKKMVSKRENWVAYCFKEIPSSEVLVLDESVSQGLERCNGEWSRIVYLHEKRFVSAMWKKG